MERDNSLTFKLLELMQKTGYPIVQHNGQRKFGPPPDWTGPPPPKGCEIFVGKLPREIFEDELVPVFSKIGKIYEMRLMMDFSGSNRGYAFVTFSKKSEASAAVKRLDGYEIRPRRNIGVVKSVDNCRLFVGGLPKTKTKEDILEELSKRVLGIVDVIVYKNCYDKRFNRGFAFVEFTSHKAAAMARRILIPGAKLWDQEVMVDWAEPEPEIDDEQMKKVKVLYARNFQIRTAPDTIKSVFESAIDNKIERVKKIYDYAFIHFYKRAHAELAMEKLQNADIDGTEIEIRWAKPVDRELYKIQKMSKGNAKFNRNFDHTQTLMLYKQHVEKREYEKSPKEDEGIGSTCAGDSQCCSPSSKVPGYPYTAPQQNYSLPPAKLDAICKRYVWMPPIYSYQKYIDAAYGEVWVCSVELPEVGVPLSTNGKIGPFMTRPCYSYQQAQMEAAELALNTIMLLHTDIQPVFPAPFQTAFAPIIPAVPNNFNYTCDYTNSLYQRPSMPLTLSQMWSSV